MLKKKTLLCISYSTCPTFYVNKHLSCLINGRVPTKGRNYVRTRNLRIDRLVDFFNIVLRRIGNISAIQWWRPLVTSDQF